MKTSEATLGEILALAARHFGVAQDELRPDDDLFEALGIDSLKALELLTRLEQHFGIELPDWEMHDVTDFRTLAQRIHARIG